MHQFNLKEKTFNFELSCRSYQIFFSGDWYIKNLEELNIQLIDTETNKNVKLKSKDFFGKQKAVLAYEFDNLKYSKLKLSIINPELLILKKAHPFLIFPIQFFQR